MVTYEEFLEEQKRKGIEKIELIEFSDSGDSCVFANIHGDPKEYIDVARKAQDLKYIQSKLEGTQEFYDSLKEFIGAAKDDVKITNGPVGSATKDEFLKGEEIIKQLISEINPEWSTKQKAAFVHYKMGQLVSYLPDVKVSGEYVPTKITGGARNIWKALSEGKSVCNGVTYIQQNILARLGIKTRELSSGSHSFMLVETDEGNIISDATWDLTNTLYGAMPTHFGVTYEDLRKREQGLSNAHKLEETPENIVGIEEEELREIFHSIGFTDENRSFKFPLYYKFKGLEEKHFENQQEKITAFLEIITKDFPKEATHLQETRSIIESFIEEIGVAKENITTRYVYDRDDEECKNPHLILHIDDEEMKNKVKFLNIDKMSFDDIEIEELDKQYKKHDLDTREPFWKQYIKTQEKEVTIIEKENEQKEW